MMGIEKMMLAKQNTSAREKRGENAGFFDKKLRKDIDIAKIPGIGKKIREKIALIYPRTDRALNALMTGTLGIVPGISFKQAAQFRTSFLKMIYGESRGDILKNEDIVEIYGNIISIIAEFANTDYARAMLKTFYPLSSSNIPIIKLRREYFARSLEFVRYIESELIANAPEWNRRISLLNKALSVLQAPIFDSNIKIGVNRVIVADSRNIMATLDEFDPENLIPKEFIEFENPEDVNERIRRLSENYDLIIYIGENSDYLPDIPNIIAYTPRKLIPEMVLPERIIQFFAQNSKLIKAISGIAGILKDLEEKLSDDPQLSGILNRFTEIIDTGLVHKLYENTRIMNERGEIIRGVDRELDKVRDLLHNFTNIISEIEVKINDTIEEQIGGTSIQISGKKILSLFQSDLRPEDLRDYIPDEVNDFILDTIYDNIESIKEIFGLKTQDEMYVEKLMPQNIEYPISLNDEGISGLRRLLEARSSLKQYNTFVKIAESLGDSREYIIALLERLLEFDLFYTVGKFAYEYELDIPAIEFNERGFAALNLKNIFLMHSDKAIEVEPISYHIGTIKMEIDGISPQSSKLNLLTGSNSGGKTQCLLSCAQAIILAQMGFPSPGKLTFYPFDELYYFKKSSGQISAGAFETTLLNFVSMANSESLKLIFADELEAITEPNAASKVLAGIFSLLLKNPNNFGIFVTHLVEFIINEIPDNLMDRIRIDGIEASGLDENLELIVDRSPKFNYLAKSTPELILSRLSKMGDSSQRKFFADLLKKFD